MDARQCGHANLALCASTDLHIHSVFDRKSTDCHVLLGLSPRRQPVSLALKIGFAGGDDWANTRPFAKHWEGRQPSELVRPFGMRENVLMSSPVQFDYRAFIEELKELHDRPSSWADAARSESSREFKHWRHELSDLISRIKTQRYPVNINLARDFSALYPHHGKSMQASNRFCFDSALTETLDEIALVLQRYEKYGEPKVAYTKPTPPVPEPPVPESGVREPTSAQTPTVAARVGLQPPERVTLRWLWEHVSIPWWGWGATGLVALLAAAFKLGVYAQSHHLFGL